MTNNSKIILALLAGAAVGATLGLLLAPDKGSENLKNLEDLKDKILDNLKDKAEKGLEALSDVTGSFAEKITENMDKAEEFVRQGADGLKSNVK